MGHELSHDPSFSIENLTREKLEKTGLNPENISEIMNLKLVYDQCNTGKLVDVKTLQNKLHTIADDIKHNIDEVKINTGNLLSTDLVDRKQQVENGLEDLTKGISGRGIATNKDK